MTIVCKDYLETLISKENFVEVQRAIGRLVDGLPEEGFIPRLVDTYGAKRPQFGAVYGTEALWLIVPLTPSRGTAH
jgi:hypothetical protein